MRNRRLHDALRAFALDSARALSADLEAGAEVAFELDERSTGRSVLYRYRPLIATFISERWQQLRTLESFGAAAEELGSGAAEKAEEAAAIDTLSNDAVVGEAGTGPGARDDADEDPAGTRSRRSRRGGRSRRRKSATSGDGDGGAPGQDDAAAPDQPQGDPAAEAPSDGE